MQPDYRQYKAVQRGPTHFRLCFDLQLSITETAFAFQIWPSSVSSALLLHHSPNTPGTHHLRLAVLSELFASTALLANSLNTVEGAAATAALVLVIPAASVWKLVGVRVYVLSPCCSCLFIVKPVVLPEMFLIMVGYVAQAHDL